jgi:hypothetical protein
VSTVPSRLAPDAASGDLTLREAAALYPIAVRTLRTKVGRGEIGGYKVRGLRGSEWRVTRTALEASGLRPLSHGPDATAPEGPTAAVQRELAEAWRIVRMERNRAAAADRELGYVLMECGRLRAVVATLEHRLAAQRSVGASAVTPARDQVAAPGR